MHTIKNNLLLLKTICYTSNPKRELSILELEALYDSSKRNNDKLSITGILVLHNNIFFQILEGEETVVNTLYQKIKKDPRHKNINEVLNFSIKEKTFNEFGVGYSIIKNMGALYAFQEYVDYVSENHKKHSSFFSNIISNLLSSPA